MYMQFMYGVTGMIGEKETNGDISGWFTNKKKPLFQGAFILLLNVIIIIDG
jgi:hypothetical protein